MATKKLSNILARDVIDARVKELGALTASGQDALPTLALEVAQWAQEGSISPTAPKKDDKDQTDDIRTIFEEYANSANANKVFADRSKESNSNTAQVSKLRTFAKLGARSDIHGPDFLARVREFRNDEAKIGNAVKPAYEAMRTAAVAVSDKNDLTEDEMRAAVRTKGKGETTALSIYSSVKAKLKVLIEEKLDTSATAKSIQQLVNQQISQLESAAKFTAWQKAGEEFGFSVTSESNEEIAE